MSLATACVASRAVASAACQAGCSGRGVDVDGRRGARGGLPVGRRARSAGGARPVPSRVRGHLLYARRHPRRAPLTVVAALGRGSQQSVKSTLVPDAETATETATETGTETAAETAAETAMDDPAAGGEGDGIIDAPPAGADADDAAAIARRTLPSGMEIVAAEEASEFEVAAELRATAFYEDLEARQALPFPPRFVATFRREFAQRERRALEERTSQPTGPSRRCLCLMSRAPDLGLTGCLDVSVRTGPCASQVNGVCVGEGEEYVYIDNVAVDAGARRRGSASAMLEASSDVAVRWGAGFVYTHVHAENVAARRLYHAYGFRAPKGIPIKEAISPGKGAQWSSPRLAGLVLLRAPLPLMQAASEKAAAAIGDCTCGAKYDECDECVCHPARD